MSPSSETVMFDGLAELDASFYEGNRLKLCDSVKLETVLALFMVNAYCYSSRHYVSHKITSSIVSLLNFGL